MKTRQLTTISMLTALYVVLSLLTPVRLENFKFTFEAFPILVAGLLYGPLEGGLVGFLGSLIYQLFFSGYGITVTTALWILPHAASGLFVGYIAKALKFDMKLYQTVITTALSAFLVTGLNTLALYVDAKVFGYYSQKLVFGTLIFKFIAGVLLAICYSLIIPSIIKQLKKVK